MVRIGSVENQTFLFEYTYTVYDIRYTYTLLHILLIAMSLNPKASAFTTFPLATAIISIKSSSPIS